LPSPRFFTSPTFLPSPGLLSIDLAGEEEAKANNITRAELFAGLLRGFAGHLHGRDAAALAAVEDALATYFAARYSTVPTRCP